MTEASKSPCGGAPKGNKNALRHGLRATRLPPGCGGFRKSIDALRRTLESEVQRIRGGVSIDDAALIQTVLRYERHALLCERWLRVDHDSLAPADRLAMSQAAVDASTRRDKIIRDELGLRHVDSGSGSKPANDDWQAARIRAAQQRAQQAEGGSDDA